MEAVRTSETSVSFNVTTRSYIPEDSKLQRHQKFIILTYLVLDYSTTLRQVLMLYSMW
jgi:hypothetical protein